MKIIKYKKRNKHTWKKTDNGEIDTFAEAYEFCNGPVCERCGYSFCVHCNPEGYEDTNCVAEEYECQNCGIGVCETDKYCRECGADLSGVLYEERE